MVGLFNLKLCPVCRGSIEVEGNLIARHSDSKGLCYGSYMPYVEPVAAKKKISSLEGYMQSMAQHNLSPRKPRKKGRSSN